MSKCLYCGYLSLQNNCGRTVCKTIERLMEIGVTPQQFQLAYERQQKNKQKTLNRLQELKEKIREGIL